MKTLIIPIGAFFGFLSVALGAFGAHGMKNRVTTDLLEIYMTASHYLTIHAIALVLYGLWIKTLAMDEVKCWPAGAFIVGTLIFSGSLYAITFTEIKKFGAITPIGGVLLLSGWLGFAIQAYRHAKP